MKRMLGLIALLILSPAFADGDAAGVTASGVVFYKNKDGALTKHDAKLFVPAKGMGKVSISVAGQDVESHAFKVVKQNGRTIFNVVFVNPPQAPKDTAIFFTGTYMRGSNAAVYYGDMFARHFQPHDEETSALDGTEKGWHHIGGFGFKAQAHKP